jgi:hypothetical protein
MARKKTAPQAEEVRAVLAVRLNEVRTEFYGEEGAADMARALGLPARTWYNDERGVAVPAEVVLRFLERTGAKPAWPLHGRGQKYRGQSPPTDGVPPAPANESADLIDGLARLFEGGRLAIEVAWRPPEHGR